ncbi:MAG: hypothetical protein AAFV72_19230 [Cyanobacteria bacterium J06635_1]
MFRQVCSTLFSQLEQHTRFWMPLAGSEPVSVFGMDKLLVPEPIPVNQPQMVQDFKVGLHRFGDDYFELLSEEVFSALKEAGELPPTRFEFPADIWVKLLYEFAAAYHHRPPYRPHLLSLLTPLYLGQVASFITRTGAMTFDEAEAEVEALAQLCENAKPYLLAHWQKGWQPWLAILL